MKNTSMLFSLMLASTASVAVEDGVNYRGDKLSFPVNVTGTYEGSNNDEAVCVPATTTLRGLSNLTEDGLKVRLANVFGEPVDCKSKRPVDGKAVIKLSKPVVESSGPSRYGLTYGGLVVPFKYNVNGDKEFRNGGTVAPYLGYRFDRNYLGFGARLVGFLGGAGVPVEQTVDGVKRTQTLAGVSYGVGLIGTVKGDFQFGLVFGADRVSRSANYANNGKWWVAFGIGSSFAD